MQTIIFFNVLSCLFSKLFKLTPQIMRERSAEKLFEKTGNKINKKTTRNSLHFFGYTCLTILTPQRKKMKRRNFDNKHKPYLKKSCFWILALLKKKIVWNVLALKLLLGLGQFFIGYFDICQMFIEANFQK